MRLGDARRITPGDARDDLGLLADCDWIDRGRDRGRRRQAAASTRPSTRVRAARPIVTSNTSTIPLAELPGLPRAAADCDHALLQPAALPAAARGGRRPTTRPGGDAIACADDAARQDRRALQRHAGLHRQPARRVWIDVAIGRGGRAAASTSSSPTPPSRGPFGSPKTGVFGLLDLVGIDLSLDVDASLADAARRPTTRCQASTARWPLSRRWSPSGRTGRKGDGGFYRLDAATARSSPSTSTTRRVPPGARLPRRRARGARLRRRPCSRRRWPTPSDPGPRCRGDPDAVDLAMEAGYGLARAGRSRCSAAGARRPPTARRGCACADLKQDRRAGRAQRARRRCGTSATACSASSSTRR